MELVVRKLSVKIIKYLNIKFEIKTDFYENLITVKLFLIKFYNLLN